MSKEGVSIPLEGLIGLHNDLAAELAAAKISVDGIKQAVGEEAVKDDPSFNYALGRTVGFEMALNGLRAFVITEAADQADLLHLSQLDGPEDTQQTS